MFHTREQCKFDFCLLCDKGTFAESFVGEFMREPDIELSPEPFNCGHRSDIQCTGCTPYHPDNNSTAVPKLPKWRQMQQQDAEEFFAWVTAGINQRWLKGMETYESHLSGFKGNPIDHAIEEVLDLVLYLWIEKRKQSVSDN